MSAVTVGKAVKKPVEIEFIVWSGGAEEAATIIGWIEENGGEASYLEENDILAEDGFTDEHIEIYTLEGVMTAFAGSRIIRGVQGEFYPCKPDIFTETYDIITEQEI